MGSTSKSQIIGIVALIVGAAVLGITIYLWVITADNDFGDDGLKTQKLQFMSKNTMNCKIPQRVFKISQGILERFNRGVFDFSTTNKRYMVVLMCGSIKTHLGDSRLKLVNETT